jgi:hypothetical protein
MYETAYSATMRSVALMIGFQYIGVILAAGALAAAVIGWEPLGFLSVVIEGWVIVLALTAARSNARTQ